MYHRKVHPSSRTKHLSHWTAVEYLPTCLSAYAAVAEQSRSTDYLITDYGIRIILAPMRLLERWGMGHRSTARTMVILFCPSTTRTATGIYGLEVQMACTVVASGVWALGLVQSACTTVSGNTWIMKMCQNPCLGRGRMGTSGLDAVSIQLMLLCSPSKAHDMPCSIYLAVKLK